MTRPRTTRRALLATVGAGAIAGCTGDGSGGSSDGTVTEDGDAGSDDGTGTGDLDLAEANVTGVETERQEDTASGTTWRFSVTLYHDDDGEGGYANWWQVETLDGEKLGRRKLLHAHSTDPFTRSETIEVPEDVSCVVVRGHDQTHGYGGSVMLVSFDSGMRAVNQGSEKQSFETSDCP
jgi:hypothetical protein